MFLPPLPKLASQWHSFLPCNDKGVSSLQVFGLAAAAAAAGGIPGSPAPVAADAVASLLAAALLIACAYTPTKTYKLN